MNSRYNAFAISDRARERRITDPRTIDGTVGMLLDEDGNLIRLPEMDRAMREAESQPLAYPPVGGTADFLKAAQDWIWDEGSARLETDTARVAFATLGGTGALYMAFSFSRLQSFELLYPGIGWSDYPQIAKASGVASKPYSLFDASGGFNLSSIEGIIRRDCRKFRGFTVLVNDPCQNPTGYTMTDGEVEALYELAREAKEKYRVQVDILWDAAYIDFSSVRPSWVRYSIDAVPPTKSLVAFSASKSFGAYGLRVGALFALFDVRKEDKARNMVEFMSDQAYGTYSNPNGYGMGVATELMASENRDSIRSHIGEWTKLVDRRTEILLDGLHGKGIQTLPHRGGFYLVVRSPIDPERAEDLLEEESVFLSPVGMNMLRISVASIATDQIDRLVEVLRRVLGK